MSVVEFKPQKAVAIEDNARLDAACRAYSPDCWDEYPDRIRHARRERMSRALSAAAVAPPADNGPHIAGCAICGACGHEWSSVASIGTVHLDCPQCKRMWGVFKNAIEPDTAWRCDCGELLFWIIPSGVMCRKCGMLQTGWF
jgi:hypothetical protein